MYHSLRRSILLVALLLLGSFAQAGTLDRFMETRCKSGCVEPQSLMSAVHRVASSFKIDPRAILAIVAVESSFKQHARNGNSVGLTQVLFTIHRKKFRGKDPYDIEDNLFAGMRVFKDCLAKHSHSYPQAFSCYNGYHKGDPKYRKKTMSAYQELQNYQLPESHPDPLGQFIAANYTHTPSLTAQTASASPHTSVAYLPPHKPKKTLKHRRR